MARKNSRGNLPYCGDHLHQIDDVFEEIFRGYGALLVDLEAATADKRDMVDSSGVHYPGLDCMHAQILSDAVVRVLQ